MATPYVTITLDEVESTQDVATKKLQSSALPVLIVASRQTGGRGRSGNVWWQAPRGVAASLAFSNDALVVDETFTLAVGLAVREAIAEVVEIDVALKWPNDIEVGGAKVGGILVERGGAHTVVGCGVNLWWPDPPVGATGLFPADPGPAVGTDLSRHWAAGLLSGAVVWDRERYIAACSTIGCQVTWDPSGSGTAIDIDRAGGLVVQTGRRAVTIRSGEVRTVRRMG
jgi:BirA family biotin operon repressor/biotin-[acetyl-CoA-carboxylase] ligase